MRMVHDPADARGVGRRRRAARRRPRSATTRSSSSGWSSGPGTSRCRSSPTSTATSSTSTSATARSSGATRRSSRSRPSPRLDPAVAGRDLRRRRAPDGGGPLPLRRHGRVPDGRRLGRVLLHRGQPARAGGAHGHRGGDRHRHREGPDPDRAGRRDRRRPTAACPLQEDDPRQRLGDAVPHHHRGPREPLHPRLRAHQRLPRGHRLRDPPRRRHGLLVGRHHPVLRLAAREGDGLGADARGVDPRMDRALREFRIRGVTTNLAVPRGPDRPPAASARATTRRASSTRPPSSSASGRGATAPPGCWRSSAR